jgi:hypothetical protein
MSTPPTALQLFLADHDALCPVCGYSLRGLAAAACPECSTPVSLTLDLSALDRPGSAPPTLSLALGAMLLTSATAGIQASLLGYFVFCEGGQVSGMPWLVLGSYALPLAAAVLGLGAIGRARTNPARRARAIRSALLVAVIAQSAQLLVVLLRLSRVGF